jgi:transposase
MKTVIVNFSDGTFEETFLVRFPDQVDEEDIEEVVEKVRKVQTDELNLPEDWTYEEVMDYIVQKFKGAYIKHELWSFYL